MIIVEEIKKTSEDYIDLVFDFLVRIVGLSYCSSPDEPLSKKGFMRIVYSSTLVLVCLVASIYLPNLSFTDVHDITDRMIEVVYNFFNIAYLLVIYFTHTLNERVYWKIRYDIEKIADFHLCPKRFTYFRTAVICALMLLAYGYWLYPFLSVEQCPKTYIGFFYRLTKYYPGIYGTVATFKTALLLCRIKRQYIILNDSYKYFNANAYFISEYKLLLGSKETIEEIRLRLFKEYKATHLALGEFVQSVNAHFTSALLIDIARAFNVIYFGAYWMVRVFYKRGYYSEEGGYITILLQFTKLMALSSVCSGIEREFDRSKCELDPILEGASGDEMQKEAMSLVDHLRGRVCVSASGMFLINYTMMFNMAGAFLTNFVILVQLRFPDLLTT